MSKCLGDIRKAAKKFLSDEDTEDLIRLMEAEKRLRLNSVESIESHLQKKAEEIAEELKRAAMNQKRALLINIQARQRIMDFVETNFKDRPDLALEGLMVGNKFWRNSIYARGNSIEQGLIGGMISELRQGDLLPVLNSREIDLDIAKEMWELGKADGKPGVSGNEHAKQIAEIFNKYQDIAVRIQNDLGADIRKLPGYIVRQSHDMFRLRRLGFDRWREVMLKNLDHNRTFKGQDPEEFLKEAYNSLQSGVHIKNQGSKLDEIALEGFEGPQSLAKKVSQERVFHFKNAEAWYNYNQEFGTGNVTESVFGGLMRAGRNAALMEGFGTNPRAMFKSIQKRLLKKYKNNTNMVDKLKSKKFEWYMNELDGESRIPGKAIGASIASFIRGVQNWSKLGFAVLSSLNDIATKAAQLKYNGVTYLEAYKNALESVTGQFSGVKQRQVSDLIGVGMEGMLGKINSRWSGDENLGRISAKMNQLFFKASLLAPWTDAHKTGFVHMLSRHLGQHSNIKYNSLPKELKTAMGMYFGEKEWNVLRKAKTSIEGRDYITPDAISDADIKKVFGDLSDAEIRKTRQKLETDLRAYYLDQADAAIPTPGARENALMRRGTKPGTVLGEAMRFVMQFKSFPVTFVTRGLGKFFPGQEAWYRQLVNGQADVRGLAHMMVATTAMGYLAMTAKDLLKGRKPREFKDGKAATKIFIASFVQGGGAGIYGDFLFGETSRFGRGALSTFLGPTWGTATDVVDTVKLPFKGEFKQAGSKGFYTIKSNLPFANLFYTKAMLDYMIMYELQEAMNPGYLRRMEKRIKKDNDQEFFVSPSSAVQGGLLN